MLNPKIETQMLLSSSGSRGSRQTSTKRRQIQGHLYYSNLPESMSTLNGQWNNHHDPRPLQKKPRVCTPAARKRRFAANSSACPRCPDGISATLVLPSGGSGSDSDSGSGSGSGSGSVILLVMAQCLLLAVAVSCFCWLETW